MKNPKFEEIETREDLECWKVQETCLVLLGTWLNDSDSHDGEEGREHQPLMTADGAWYFVPRYDDPVMSRARIGHPPSPLPDRPRWGIEVVEIEHATRWEPESMDLVEIDRVDSLYEAFCAVRHHLLERELCDVTMGVEAQYESRLAPFIEDYMTPTE